MTEQLNQQNAEIKIHEVATRISQLRQDLNLTVEEMAEQTGYSVEDYRSFESGEKDFSFTFIFNIVTNCSN